MNEQLAGNMRTRLLLLIMVLLLAACGSVGGAASNPANGKQLFDGTIAMASDRAPACATCHAIAPGMDTGSGQSLSNIGNRAGATVPGQPAEEYLRTAITNPDAFLSGGYQEGIMYRDYAQALTAQQINDLVAYMLTLKSGQDH
jgi:cytochrome c553